MSIAERWRFHPTVLYLTSPISLTHSCLVPKSCCFFFFLPGHTFFTNTEKVQTETICCRSPKDSHRSSTEPQTFPIHRIWALFSPIYRVTQLQKSQPLRAPLHGTAPQGAGIAPSLQIPAPQQPAPDSSQELKPFPHVPIPWNTSLLRAHPMTNPKNLNPRKRYCFLHHLKLLW